MPLSRDSRTEKKLKALRRAQFRLKQTLDYIDWCEDTLYPEIEALKAGRPVLGLEAGAMFDIQVDHADPTLRHEAADAPARPHDPRRTTPRRRAKPARAGAGLRPRK
jgi:hypothetical protein